MKTFKGVLWFFLKIVFTTILVFLALALNIGSSEPRALVTEAIGSLFFAATWVLLDVIETQQNTLKATLYQIDAQLDMNSVVLMKAKNLITEQVETIRVLRLAAGSESVRRAILAEGLAEVKRLTLQKTPINSQFLNELVTSVLAASREVKG